MQVTTPAELHKNHSWKITELLPEHAAAFTATGILPANIELLKHDLPKIEGITPIKGPLKIFEAASDQNRAVTIRMGLAEGASPSFTSKTTLDEWMPALKALPVNWPATFAEVIKDLRDPHRTSVKKPVVEAIQASLELLDYLFVKLQAYLPASVASHSQTIAIPLKIGEKLCLAYVTAQDTNPAIEGELK